MQLAVLGTVLAIAAGCSRPRYTYEPRPPLPPAATAATAAERCYHGDQLAIAGASVDWARHVPGYSLDTMISTFYRDGGLVLYRGPQRLDSRAALRRIGEPVLTRDYEALLASTERDYRMYPVYRNTAIALVVAGAAMVVAGSLWLLDDAGEPGDGHAPAYLMLGGLGVSTASLIPALFAYRSIDGNLTHERHLRLFSDDRFLSPLAAGARRHNEQLAATCGAPAPDLPLPMTRTARAVVGDR